MGGAPASLPSLPSPFSLPFLDLLPLSDANFFPVVALPPPSSTTRWQTQLVSVLRGSSSSWVPPLERRGEEWRAAAQKSLDAFVRSIISCSAVGRRRSSGGLATGELCQTSRGVELGWKKSV